MTADWTLIDHWVSVYSDTGKALSANPSNELVLFNPDDHPEFDPCRWNSADFKANCLAYALNAFGEDIQPGYARPPYLSNRPDLMDEFTKVSYRLFQNIPQDEFRDIVRMGLELDGLNRVQSIEGLYKPEHYLIGLFIVDKEIAGRNDFHFVRLDNNGFWSMVRYGDYEGVSFHDFDDEKIKNPATVQLSGTLKFDGFYHVPTGGASALRQLKPSS